MIQIPDDPIISYMERTGYAPWLQDEEDDYTENSEPFAIYDPY